MHILQERFYDRIFIKIKVWRVKKKAAILENDSNRDTGTHAASF